MQHFKVDPVLNINPTFHSIQDLRGLTVPKNFPKVQIIPTSLLNSFQSPYFILLLPTSTPNCSISHLFPPIFIPVLFPLLHTWSLRLNLFPIPSMFLLYFPLLSFLLLPTSWPITPYSLSYSFLQTMYYWPLFSFLLYSSFSCVFPITSTSPSLNTLKPCLATHHFSSTSSSLISM